ncbi:MAG: RNA polymerase sigma factor (sigma-70 family) [Maribacter sp.]|jgi:RNA polymerase sigma factor (sigma-70 family)
MDITSEESLWYFFKKGEINAFKALFKKYYPTLHAYGLKISNSSQLTEDCLQSFFVYLFENRDNLGDVINLRSYLFSSFKRALFKQIQKQRLKTSLNDSNLLEYGITFSPQELAIAQESQFLCSDTLHNLLNELSSREKEVVYLKYYSDLSTSEISEVMDISYQSVSNTLQKAMLKLRKGTESQQIKNILKKY